MRIPRHLDTQPSIIWTLVPRSLGHLTRIHMDRQWERSDAGLHSQSEAPVVVNFVARLRIDMHRSSRFKRRWAVACCSI